MTDEPVADNKIRALRADQPQLEDAHRKFIETIAEFMPKPHLGACTGFVMVTFYEKGDAEFWHIDDDPESIKHRMAYAGALLSNRAVVGQDGG